MNKPITHNHVGVGTLCYKYNRGNITLKGDRAAPFMIYSTSQTNYRAIKNATFINLLMEVPEGVKPRFIVEVNGIETSSFYVTSKR